MSQPTEPSRRLGKDDILARVAPLFADNGYAGVSMRDLAKICAVTPAALYHHFDDKEQLYLETVAYAFETGSRGMDKLLEVDGTLEEQIRRLVGWFTGVVGNDTVFRRMLHRELLDGDTARMRLLVRRVFAEPFRRVLELEKRLVPRYDPYMLAVSLVSLVLGHFELRPIRRFLEGQDDAPDNTQAIIEHIADLLLHGLETAGKR